MITKCEGYLSRKCAYWQSIGKIIFGEVYILIQVGIQIEEMDFKCEVIADTKKHLTLGWQDKVKG